jgi:hypothetical protein
MTGLKLMVSQVTDVAEKDFQEPSNDEPELRLCLFVECFHI